MVLFMDAYKTEPQLVSAAVEENKASAAVSAKEAVRRPPLLPSERNNAAAAAAATTGLHRKPQPREIASRYKSHANNPTNAAPVPSRKTNAATRLPSPSPAVSGRAGPLHGQMQQKRAQSVERRPASAKIAPAAAAPPRRSAPSSPSSSRTSTTSSPSSSRSSTPVRDSSLDVHASSKRVAPLRRSVDGLWPSMRSLSSSMNSEPASPSSVNKDKTSVSNDWTPTTTEIAAPNPKSKPSSDLHKDGKRTPLRGRNPSDQLENAKPVEVSLSRANVPTKRADQQRWPGTGVMRFSSNAMARSVDLTPFLPVPSRGVSPRRRAPSSDDAPSRVLLPRSTSDGSRRMSLDGTRRAETQIGSVYPASSRPLTLERSSSATRQSRTLSVPAPCGNRPPSPSRQPFPLPSSVRGMPSPSRTRPSTPISSPASATGRSVVPSSVLSYIADSRKVKKNANHIEDVHQLRLAYNRCLQWRFANARADLAHSNQKMMAENVLHNVCISALELRKSVLLRKISIQKQMQELKLNTILREQIAYLEDWALLEREHSSSLSGAIEALKASTIRLPVTGGATACFHDINNAICSALDVMQAIGSSMCDFLSRVEDTGSVVSELAKVATNERAMIDNCRALLALTAALQVQESSLQTHLLQLGDNKMQLS